MPQVFIDVDKLKLVFGMARHGAPDPDSLVVVNNVAGDTLTFLKALAQAEAAKAQQAKEAADKAAQEEADAAQAQQAATTAQEPIAPPKSAVEEFGIDSPEAEAKRQERREKRLADDASRKAGKEPPVGVPEPA